MSTESIKSAANSSSDKSFLDRREAMPTSLAAAFPNDRIPEDSELSVDIGDVRQAPNDFFRSKGPLFAACWLLNHFATAESIGGDATQVPYEDVRERMARIFRSDDDFGSYIRGAYDWYRRLHGGTD